MILENLNIPQSTGCYLFRDSKDKIMLVSLSLHFINNSKLF